MKKLEGICYAAEGVDSSTTQVVCYRRQPDGSVLAYEYAVVGAFGDWLESAPMSRVGGDDTPCRSNELAIKDADELVDMLNDRAEMRGFLDTTLIQEAETA